MIGGVNWFRTLETPNKGVRRWVAQFGISGKTKTKLVNRTVSTDLYGLVHGYRNSWGKTKIQALGRIFVIYLEFRTEITTQLPEAETSLRLFWP